MGVLQRNATEYIPRDIEDAEQQQQTADSGRTSTNERLMTSQRSSERFGQRTNERTNKRKVNPCRRQPSNLRAQNQLFPYVDIFKPSCGTYCSQSWVGVLSCYRTIAFSRTLAEEVFFLRQRKLFVVRRWCCLVVQSNHAGGE